FPQHSGSSCPRVGAPRPMPHRAPPDARAPTGDVLVNTPKNLDFSGAPMSVWEIVDLARHPQRPYSLDYIRRLAPDFIELHGDRLSADDPPLVGGVGTWHGRTTAFLGQ